jgi:hypothetical protein
MGHEEVYSVGETRTGVTLRRHLPGRTCVWYYHTLFPTKPVFRNNGSLVISRPAAGTVCLLVIDVVNQLLVSFDNTLD